MKKHRLQRRKHDESLHFKGVLTTAHWFFTWWLGPISFWAAAAAAVWTTTTTTTTTTTLLVPTVLKVLFRSLTYFVLLFTCWPYMPPWIFDHDVMRTIGRDTWKLMSILKDSIQSVRDPNPNCMIPFILYLISFIYIYIYIYIVWLNTYKNI